MRTHYNLHHFKGLSWHSFKQTVVVMSDSRLEISFLMWCPDLTIYCYGTQLLEQELLTTKEA